MIPASLFYSFVILFLEACTFWGDGVLGLWGRSGWCEEGQLLDPSVQNRSSFFLPKIGKGRVGMSRPYMILLGWNGLFLKCMDSFHYLDCHLHIKWYLLENGIRSTSTGYCTVALEHRPLEKYLYCLVQFFSVGSQCEPSNSLF